MFQARLANLSIMIDRSSRSPYHEQIYAEVSEAIRTGRLKAGEKLPSIRQLQSDLCVSHTIVEQAYLELVTEGYVRSVPRSGYVVESIDTGFFKDEPKPERLSLDDALLSAVGHGLRGEEDQGKEVRFDFSYARLRPGSFPIRAWQRACNEVCLGGNALFERYSYHGVVTPLQEEIARHLHQARGVECDPRQILLEPGSPSAVYDLLRVFDPGTESIGVEEPGWQVPGIVASEMGFAIHSIPSDGSAEAFASELLRISPRISFLTPSHQFPTGEVLPLKERIEILEWMEDSDSYVVEDDSCYEYRYDMRPIPSLYALGDGARSVYLGNFSKVLSPSLRIAYLVLPTTLLERFLALSPSGHPGVSAFEAAVLAQLMASGDYNGHVGRMVRNNKRSHDALLKCLTERFGELVDISGKQSGMHLFVRVGNGMTTDELIASALAQGAKVYSPRRYWWSEPMPEGVVMIGFSAMDAGQIAEGVDALARAWLA